MTEPTTVEWFYAVNQDGDCTCSGESLQDAIDTLTSDYGAEAIRTWTTKFSLSLPEAPELEVTVPDEAGQTVTASVAP